MKTKLILPVIFKAKRTNPEALTSALDQVIETALSTAGLLSEYGDPTVGTFSVLDTEAAKEHAEALDALIDGQDDELGEMLIPIRDFLKRLAT